MIRSARRSLVTATLVAVGTAVAGVVIYLAASEATLRLGFPLDDAWIHQTYARNLALRGEWSFVPGAASGGSTAPLWTVFLAIGARLAADPRPWAYALGTVALAGAAAAAVRVRVGGAIGGWWLPWLGFVFAAEWHLLWAAASGMEVILLIALAVVVLLLSLPAVRRPGLAGVFVGLGIWIRPDAITLAFIPLAVILLTSDRDIRSRGGDAVKLAVGAALPVVPYLIFNLGTAGTIWPSTFYAKQAEYAILRETPLLARVGRLALAPLAGSGILLVPGVVLVAVESIRSRRWVDLAPLVWGVLYLSIFAAGLPVAYQHGRYQMPILPVIIVFGWHGVAHAVSGARRPFLRVLTRAWAAAIVALTVLFAGIGARAYAFDVALIETEMVESAKWIASRTEPDALVAAHDIGALGYFGGRRVLDMAGLAEADVIPILRDEARLAAYLTRAGASYLMTFPGWYPALVGCAERIYTTDAPFSPMQGGENMAVYRWMGPSVVAPEGCMLYSP